MAQVESLPCKAVFVLHSGCLTACVVGRERALDLASAGGNAAAAAAGTTAGIATTCSSSISFSVSRCAALVALILLPPSAVKRL